MPAMHPDNDSPAPAGRLPLVAWLSEGLRAGFFLRPRLSQQQPSPAQILILVVLVSALELVLARFEIAGPASFNLRDWLAPQWATALLLLLVWWILPREQDGHRALPAGLPAWFALWTVAALPANTVSQLLGIAQEYEQLPAPLIGMTWVAWAVYLLLWAWMVGAAVRLASRFGVDRLRQAVLGLGLVTIFGLSAWQFPERPWQALASGDAAAAEKLQLSQETIEAQQAVWRNAVASLAPQRPGVQDVYGLVFAPFADEEVFLRESSMVAQLLKDRFDANGRVLHLVNNPATSEIHPWATPLNLGRAIEALAARMDRENDLLVVYLTSHGAGDYRLAAAHGPLQMDTVSPGELREALDKSGIRHRVIAISACYSGGWLGPLAGDTTLVMTAADATHTSYGCGRLSELTFFGRAMFDEQLRRTRSFEKAFAAAVPLIRQREIDAGKPDGFSNPQISVGEKIRPFLQALEQRLDAPP